MKVKLYYCIIILLFLQTACSPNPDRIHTYLAWSMPKETLDEYLSQKVQEKNIPGMSIAFIQKGEVVYHKLFGYANLQDSIPLDKQSVFEGASLSKPIFAYFVMKYVEEGKLDLDKPLYTYLPYPDIAYDERYKKISARMVLSHQTGFPNWRNEEPDKKLRMHFDPGTGFRYSGEGYMYLSKVLKHIDDTDWEGLEKQFQEKVCKPLGMEHTVFIQDAYCIAHKVEPYDQNGEWISPAKDKDSLYRYQFRAPASIHSEAMDFSKWLIALMKREGLRETSYQELFKEHAQAEDFGPMGVRYTLGFFRPQVPFTQVFLHGGNNYGFTSFFAIDPDMQWGFVLFTNSEYGEELGTDLLLYMLVGPYQTQVWLMVGFVLLLILVGIGFFIRYLIRRYKHRA